MTNGPRMCVRHAHGRTPPSGRPLSMVLPHRWKCHAVNSHKWMQSIDRCRFVLILTSFVFFQYCAIYRNAFVSAWGIRTYGSVVSTQYEHYYVIIVFLFSIELQNRTPRIRFRLQARFHSANESVNSHFALYVCWTRRSFYIFIIFPFAFRFVRSRQLWASLLYAENILNGGNSMLYEQINKEKSQPNPSGAKFENEKRNQRYLIHVECKWYSKALIMYLLLFITILSFECQNYSMHRRTHTMSAHSLFFLLFLIDWTSETGSSSIT